MKTLLPYVVEAWRELREGLRGPLVPLMFAGLIGYLMLTLVHSEYLQQLGAADTPRNSPFLVYMMTSGQSFWLIFAWAWLFAQVVTRDRSAQLHELVLASPVSLRGLMLARAFGAFAIACLLGASTALGFLLVPLLSAAGLLPASAVGPTPYGALAWAFFIFVVPSALGLGALYLTAALRTRNVLGPFALAAALALVWMIAMVVLRGGSIDAAVATWLDPTGFAEAEEQCKSWTPHQKVTAWFALGRAFIINRLAWTLIPLGLLARALVRLRRDALVLESERRGRSAPRGTPSPQATSDAKAPPLASVTAPAWWRAVVSEARFHLAVSMRGWAFRIALGLWAVVGVAGSFVHLVAHAEGPLVPRPALLAPFLVDLCYVFSVFLVAGFVGGLARRDHAPGIDEIVDTTPAPLLTRVLGRALAAGALTCVFCLMPTVSAAAVIALGAPGSFDLTDPLLVNTLLAAPALLELCALSFFIHACIRSAGAAYALSMLVAFIAIVNHEIGVVSYPPWQVGIPGHVAISELAGWSPWFERVLAGAVAKLGLVLLAITAAALAWPVGTNRGGRVRLHAALARLRGATGALALASVALLVLTSALLHERLVARGEYRTRHEREAEAAAWEARFWSSASAFSVEGGEVDATITPSARRAQVRWSLRGLRALGAELHASLAHGMHLERASVGGEPLPHAAAHDHVAIELGDCSGRPCDVELELHIEYADWPVEDEPPWLHASGAWARARDLLPRLGHDPERVLRAPALRGSFGLAERPSALAPAALAASRAVAPQGRWRWALHFTEPGTTTATEGASDAPLDFAVAWLPQPALRTERDGVVSWHGATHADSARQIQDDLAQAQRCIEERFGSAPNVSTILQAPRGLGDVALHGDVLWLPEDEAWDVTESGFGRWQRRARITRALAARRLGDAADLRAEPGARWLLDGVAGWTGLDCVRQADGVEASFALWTRHSERVVEALGALDAPISGLASDGAAAWIEVYAPLATTGWAARAGEDEARRCVLAVVERVRAGEALASALNGATSPQVARELLGEPQASDVRAAADGAERLQIDGERWRWAGGGWQPSPYADLLVQLSGEASTGLGPLLPIPTAIATPRGSFTLLDAWPSFELSPKDNRWRGELEARRLAR